MAWVMQVFSGADGVEPSAKIETKEGELNRPVVKNVHLFWESYWDWARAGDVGASNPKRIF